MDDFGLKMMDGESNQHQPKQERLRTRWTPSLDKIFADLVVEQIQLGNRSNNAFDKKTWKDIRDSFNRQTGLNFNKKQLRKHLDVLRIRYHNLKSVFDQTGFVMDESYQMGQIVTTEFDIWDDYIEAHPKPETIKIKDCPIYEQMCTIFTESGADGRYAQSSHYEGLGKNMVAIENPSTTSPPKTAGMHVDPAAPSVVPHDSVSPVKMKSVDARKKRPSETSLSPACRKRNLDGTRDALANALFEMLAVSKLRASTKMQGDEKFSVSNCVKLLDGMQGIDEHLYFNALDLFQNPNRRETFISLKNEMRLTWLQCKCCTSIALNPAQGGNM